MSGLKSCLYTGWVRHRRFTPASNEFRYPVFMVYLDLDELEQVLRLSPWWSKNRFSPACFRREDFHGDPAMPLADAVRNTVFNLTGKTPQRPIRMLANWRYFGYNMNPLCTYYCFDSSGENLETILAEVTNTPWGESHAYALQCASANTTNITNTANTKYSFSFRKTFHVSPFNDLAMRYQWHSIAPGDSAMIHIENWRSNGNCDGEECVMDATMTLEREPLSARSMRRVLIRYPFMTVKIIAAIYWQAVKLWCKKVPFVSHPHNRPPHQLIEAKPKRKPDEIGQCR
ncbi:MAG: DUF1365 domain-containing protein [Cellvibrionaceae bacterium]|nr:DUF1365 domain-containing protein [Cellvibrionaceae bacterium]